MDLAGSLGHAAAFDWPPERWGDIDVLLVDAADERRDGDQFPGVGVVAAVRAAAPTGEPPVVIVVTGHYLHDGLRHRMAAAGADFFFLRAELWTAEDLLDVVLHPERHRRGVPPVADPDAARALGVDRSTDVEGLVGWVDGAGLGPALDPDSPRGRHDPRSRRWFRVRRAAAQAGRVQAVNLTTGDAPRDQPVPSLRQLARIWSWAARIRRHD